MPQLNYFPYLGKTGFDNARYVQAQSAAIISRAEKFQKLYLEFGGKLLYDYHAGHVLPGYHLDTKIEVVKNLARKRSVEFLFCVSAKDLQSGRRMGALGISYRDFSLKMIDSIEAHGFKVPAVAINFFKGEPAAKMFGAFLKKKGYEVYYRGMIKGYPNNMKEITSTRGFGKKPFIKTKSSIVIVTGAGPNSGKLATCLTMVYQDYLQGRDAGYAKLETFPVWNLALDSPVNVAYEAATADLKDYNLVDPYHLKAHKVKAINYNRDVEGFVIIQRLLQKIISEKNYMHNYRSPTDMGINMVAKGITNLEWCEQASRQEIIRRYFSYCEAAISGTGPEEAAGRTEKLLKKYSIRLSERAVVGPAREAAKQGKQQGKGHRGIYAGAALQLPNGEIITGSNSSLMHAESAAIIKALKALAGVPEHEHVISPEAIAQVKKLRREIYREESENLNVAEALIMLAVSSRMNEHAQLAFGKLAGLWACEMHTTHRLRAEDESCLRKLGINVTSDAVMELGKLYSG